MTSFSQLRQRHHRAWLAELKQQLDELLAATTESRPDQIYLFGARGDWDGLSDTDLLVAASMWSNG